VGLTLGTKDILGETDSNGDGFDEGIFEGAPDGFILSSLEGSNEGICDGLELGLSLGRTDILGAADGNNDGFDEGTCDGAADGFILGS
jgi:hypothetical protein